MDLCLTMRAIGAAEAVRIGLLDRVEEDPRQLACAVAGELAQLDASASARVKRIAAEATGLLSALEAERAGNAPWSGSVQGLVRPEA